MSTPNVKSKNINFSMRCTISPINDKSNKSCDITVISQKSASPRNIFENKSSDLHLSFIGTPTFSQYNEIGTNNCSSYCKNKNSGNENEILFEENEEVSRDLFSGCITTLEDTQTKNISNLNSKNGSDLIKEKDDDDDDHISSSSNKETEELNLIEDKFSQQSPIQEFITHRTSSKNRKQKSNSTKPEDVEMLDAITKSGNSITEDLSLFVEAGLKKIQNISVNKIVTHRTRSKNRKKGYNSILNLTQKTDIAIEASDTEPTPLSTGKRTKKTESFHLTRASSQNQEKNSSNSSDLVTSRNSSNDVENISSKPKSFVTKRNSSKTRLKEKNIKESQISDKQESSIDISEPTISRITRRKLSSRNQPTNSFSSNISDLVTSGNSPKTAKSFVTKRNSSKIRVEEKNIEDKQESSINISEPKISRITRRKVRTKITINKPEILSASTTDTSNTESLSVPRRTLRTRSKIQESTASESELKVVTNYVTQRITRSTVRKKLEISSDESKISETNESFSSIKMNFITNRQSKKSNLKRKTTIEVPVSPKKISVAFQENSVIEKSNVKNFESRKSKKKSVFFHPIPENEEVSSISDSLEQSTVRPSIFLRPGKWRKSLAMWRISHKSEGLLFVIYKIINLAINF